MGRRLMMLLAWVASTVLAATVAWAAVGTVGHGPGATDDTVLSQAEVEAALAARQAAASAAAATAAPTSPADDPTSSPTPAAGPTATPTPDPTRTPPPPTEIARTWAVAGGTVGATCRGASISHDYATPTDGWGVEVKSRGPEATEVEFESEHGETTVRAQCVAGVPEMTTMSGNSGSGDEHDEGDDGDDGDD